jgi:vacuolar-type H+-ATPase subunit C/Vma6
MTLYLGDLNTRARGLGTRLLSPDALGRMARTKSMFALQREMRSLGLVSSEGLMTPAALEAEVRGRAAGLLAILVRWCRDARQPVLAVLLEDEERRAIQALLRGAEQAASSESKMSGLLPTTNLPERALRTLAAQPTMEDVVRMLLLWGHPLAPSLTKALGGTRPSLLEVEAALQRAFAERARARAHRGGKELASYVAQTIDLMNLWTVLLHFPERASELTDLTFIDGGQTIDRELFDELLGQDSIQDVQRVAGKAFQGSSIGAALSVQGRPLSSLEGAVLGAQLQEQRRAARTRPEGPAPLVLFFLELRAELLNLRRIIWGKALEAPAALVESEMVGT